MTHSKRLRPNRPRGFLRNSNAAVALMFGIMAIPVLGLIGLAIDFGMWNEAYASLSLAASSAALNAVKSAASAKAQGDSSYLNEGSLAGRQWFLAELGRGAAAATVYTATPTVDVTQTGTVINATVSFNSNIRSIFGRLFMMPSYRIGVASAAAIQLPVFTEVVLMLDNSSSMGIAATEADMTKMMQNSPCYATNEWTRTAKSSTYSQTVKYYYSTYQISSSGGSYDGGISYPIVNSPLTFYAATSTVHYCDQGQVSANKCKAVLQCSTDANGNPTYAGPPCAFACHSDSSAQAGLGKDTWALARQLGVTLRMDTLKVAANKVLGAMKARNNPNLNNLSVGVYTFNTALNPIYPGTGCTPQTAGCEAASQWDTAISDVGLPPGAGSSIDTGIQPVLAQIGGNNDNTEVEEAMSNLATNYVTPAGDGSTAAKSRKVLMLITDGMEDDPTNSLRQAVPPSACQPFKDMGYTVYVIYTPYYPLMNNDYLKSLIPIVEGTGPSSITTNLTACASAATDFQVASDQNALSNALLKFLSKAVDSPATFTQ